MPSPLQDKVCEICSTAWSTRSAKARTCSPKCRAILREQETPSPGKPKREYPSELVDRIRSMYESGMTISEIQSELSGVKVQLIMTRYGIESRSTAKRDQTGSKNSSWKGDDATYTALHLRVETHRGKPSNCQRCGTADPSVRYEWANLSGNYIDISDYERMCVSCHRRYDAARRKESGRRTSPIRR